MEALGIVASWFIRSLLAIWLVFGGAQIGHHLLRLTLTLNENYGVSKSVAMLSHFGVMVSGIAAAIYLYMLKNRWLKESRMIFRRNIYVRKMGWILDLLLFFAIGFAIACSIWLSWLVEDWFTSLYK